MALDINTILPLILRTQAILTATARMKRETAHDAIAELEVVYCSAEGGDCAGAFVGGGAGGFGPEGARGDHAVGMAVAGYGYFY